MEYVVKEMEKNSFRKNLSIALHLSSMIHFNDAFHKPTDVVIKDGLFNSSHRTVFVICFLPA